MKNTTHYIKAPIHFFGMIYALLLSSFIFLSKDYGDIQLFEFLIVSLSLYLIVGLAWFYHYQKVPLTLANIIFWAVVFRLIGFFVYPILEDDAFRYMWDGYQTISSGSPYAYAPSHFFSSFDSEQGGITERFEFILDRINYPDVPTIYWPTTQYVFALATFIAPGEIWPLQFLMAVFDLVLLFVLCKLAKPIYILLYAWSPLVLKETIITAHPDIVGIAFIWLAILLKNKHVYWAACFCALAVSAKIFAILIVPFCLLFHIRAWGVFAAVFVACFLPFIQDISQLIASLSAMGENWVFNSPFYLLVLYVWPVMSLSALKLILLFLFAILGAYLFYCYVATKTEQAKTKVARGDIIFMVFLLVSPVANPWYFLWVLPFAVIYPSLWAWVASGAVFLSYCIGLNLNSPNLNNYQIPGFVVALEYGLILMAYIFERFKYLFKF